MEYIDYGLIVIKREFLIVILQTNRSICRLFFLNRWMPEWLQPMKSSNAFMRLDLLRESKKPRIISGIALHPHINGEIHE